jgi:predicted dehydrogenase
MINRVLIVGLGSMGRRHLRLARGLMPNADIRVLRHQVASEVAEFSDGCFFGIEEAIAFAPQIAVIANPAPFHITIAQALAETGVHLLVEKPLSASLNGVAHLLKTCRKKGTILFSGYNLRFLPSLQRFRDLLFEGVIGKTLSVRCEIGQYLPSWRPECDYRQGVSGRRELGGGALLELSHEIDYLRWIFGEAVWINATLSRQSSLEIDVEDTAHLTIGFAPDKSGHQLIASVNMDFIRHDNTRLCTAIGDKGSLRWNGLNGEVELFEAGAKAWRSLYSVPHQRDDSYLAEWTNFIESISKNKLPLVSGEDGLRVLEIIDAARRSAEFSGRARVATAINDSRSKL